MSPRQAASLGMAPAPSPPHSKSPSPPTEPPPPPNPALDAHFSNPDHDRAPSSPLHSPRTEQQLLDDVDNDIFRIPASSAMRLLGAGVEALVHYTGDIPPSPAPEKPEVPHMRGMEAEKESIVRSHSARTLVRLRLEAEAKARQAAGNTAAAADDNGNGHTTEGGSIDGVRLRSTGAELSGGGGGGHPPPSSPEPYTVVGDNAQPVNVQHSAITRKFYSKKPPPIGITDYLARLHRFCPASTAVYLATSLYLHRLAVDERAIAVTRRNAHRLLLAGLRVAMKALEDRSYPHSRVAQVGGVSGPELARLEISFCFLASFELVVGPEEMTSHWLRMRNPPEPLLSPTLLSRDRVLPPAPGDDDGGLEMNLLKRPKAVSGHGEL